MKEKSPYPQIDKIRAKFDDDESLSLREACFILWAELCICSAQYLMFAYWIRNVVHLPKKQKFRWRLWKDLFESFAKNDYPTMRNDFDLVVKVAKLGADIVK